ncbi:MAG TPA: hypothetical protein VII92_03340 [Anaerolineae bacterium]
MTLTAWQPQQMAMPIVAASGAHTFKAVKVNGRGLCDIYTGDGS